MIRTFWLCAQYRISHNDFLFAWMEADQKPHQPGLAVFDKPLTVHEGESLEYAFSRVRVITAPQPIEVS